MISECGRGGRQIRAHRLSWIIHNGEIPADISVLHKCDNRKCVRPDHLFLGTVADNNADMVAKGRQASRLNRDDVRAIRRAEGTTIEIAARFGIHNSQVSRIKRRKVWAHMSEPE